MRVCHALARAADPPYNLSWHLEEPLWSSQDSGHKQYHGPVGAVAPRGEMMVTVTVSRDQGGVVKHIRLRIYFQGRVERICWCIETEVREKAKYDMKTRGLGLPSTGIRKTGGDFFFSGDSCASESWGNLTIIAQQVHCTARIQTRFLNSKLNAFSKTPQLRITDKNLLSVTHARSRFKERTLKLSDLGNLL